MVDDRTTPDPRERLLDAAEELFAARGFDGASVRDICDRAGMNVASVNYHFRDKQRLYVEALKRAHCCVDGEVADLTGFPPGTRPADRLRLFVAHMVGRTHAPTRPSAMQLLMREMANPSAAGEEVILQYIRPKAFALRDILLDLLPGADPHRLLMIGFSVIGQVLFYRQNRPVVELIFGKDTVGELHAAAVAEHITRFTLAAVAKGPKYRPADPPARPEEPA